MDYVDQRGLESTSISVLLNGYPTTELKPTRGLRQGDPLVPFLFIMVVEGLFGLVRHAIKANMLKGMKVGRKEVESCVLQFVDDTLESFSDVLTIKVILRCYELASGLKINFHKSKLAGINVERNSFYVYAKSLHCTLMRVPIKYLGLEVRDNPRKNLF